MGLFQFFIQLGQELFRILISIWPLWLLLLVAGALKFFTDIYLPRLRSERKYKKLDQWYGDREQLSKLRYLKPAEFEYYIASLFSKLGYNTQVVGGSHDGGIDVIAEKDGIKHYIQCKKYFNAHQVSVGNVRDFYGSIVDKLANGKGYFITTNKFTLEAEQFASDKPI